MKKTTRIIPLFLASTLLLSGCVAAIGNRGERAQRNATLGQELIDLQKAKEAGVLSEAEYQVQRARLLDAK